MHLAPGEPLATGPVAQDHLGALALVEARAHVGDVVAGMTERMTATAPQTEVVYVCTIPGVQSR